MMKNKKPKTIEEIIKKEVSAQIGEYIVPNTYMQFVKITFDEEKVAKQIKQLIADEVIDLVTEFELDKYESNGKMFYAVSDVVSMARKRSKEQRKKLESL